MPFNHHLLLLLCGVHCWLACCCWWCSPCFSVKKGEGKEGGRLYYSPPRCLSFIIMFHHLSIIVCPVAPASCVRKGEEEGSPIAHQGVVHLHCHSFAIITSRCWLCVVGCYITCFLWEQSNREGDSHLAGWMWMMTMTCIISHVWHRLSKWHALMGWWCVIVTLLWLLGCATVVTGSQTMVARWSWWWQRWQRDVVAMMVVVEKKKVCLLMVFVSVVSSKCRLHSSV